MLPEQASGTHLEEGKEFFETTGNSGAGVIRKKFASQILKPGGKFKPAAPLFLCFSNLEPGVLPKQPVLVCKDAFLQREPLLVERNKVNGETLGRKGAGIIVNSPGA